MDPVDKEILTALLSNGRIAWSELAGHLNLSPPAIADRVKRLENKGIISGYTALIDHENLGQHLTAIMTVSLGHPKDRAAFLKAIKKIPEILECHHITGDYDYFLKIRCISTAELETKVINALKMITGVIKTRTDIVLSTCKESYGYIGEA